MPDQLVRRFIQHLEHAEVEAALDLLTNDCVYDNVPMGAVHGREAVRASLAPFLASWDEIRWPVSHQLATGTLAEGLVMNERVDQFRRGDFTLVMPVAGLFEIRDGLIAVWRDYFDRDTFVTQMAALPPAATPSS